MPLRSPREYVEIDDETWRDGMQGTHLEHHPSFEQKDLYVGQSAELGYIDHLDIGFPASGQIHRNEVINLINSSIRRSDGVTFSVAGRGAALDDVRSILEVSEKTKTPLEADLFLDASTIRAEVQRWDRDEKLRQAGQNIAHLKKEGLSVMFVPERASATSPEELIEACTIAADNGADRIAIADTTGVLTPFGTINIFREVFSSIGKKYPDIKFDFHEHDDLRMGIANCIVAAQEGVDRLHATARGIGERAGNVDLEQLLVVLNVKGFRNDNTEKIQQFAMMAAEILSRPIGEHEALIGNKWVETASGVHADTYRRKPDLYFPFDPDKVGLKPQVRIGPLSGLANVYGFCEALGIKDITEEKAREILEAAKEQWGLLSEDTVRNLVGRNGHL